MSPFPVIKLPAGVLFGHCSSVSEGSSSIRKQQCYLLDLIYLYSQTLRSLRLMFITSTRIDQFRRQDAIPPGNDIGCRLHRLLPHRTRLRIPYMGVSRPKSTIARQHMWTCRCREQEWIHLRCQYGKWRELLLCKRLLRFVSS